ncbi:hypothetical protein GCM10009839_30020 [Catenulispora yoronensis]|uniref:Uncharacterized protein n=1 Tax=Catenulispora yoronensis TaxID=450799 RepID=A0ABN2U4W4_9ACTN
MADGLDEVPEDAPEALERLDEAVPAVPVVPEAEEVTLGVAPAGDPEAAGCWAAGFAVFDEQPVAVRATSALPARSAYCRRFMSW